MSKKLTNFATVTDLLGTDWVTGIDIAAAPASQNVKITKDNLLQNHALKTETQAVQTDLDNHKATSAGSAHPDGTTATDLSNHKSGADQHPISGVTGLTAALAAKANTADLGNSASRDVGDLNTQVAAGDAPANAVSAHESSFDHTRIPTAAQKNALDANLALSGANPVAGQDDIVDEGLNLKSTGQPANKMLETNGTGGFVYIDTPSGSGATAFTELTDTPPDYTGQQGKLVKVNATEDGLIYGDPSGTTVSWGDIAGTLANQTDLQAELDAKLDDAASDGNFYARRNAAWAVAPDSPIGSVWLSYTWSTDTTATSPAVGQVKANNADLSLATGIYINETTGGGNSAASILNSLQVGDYFALYEKGSDRQEIYYQISSSPVDNTGWWTIPVTVVPGSSASLGAGVDVEPFIVRDPVNRNPVGGAAGQVLAKVDATDHNTDWVTLTPADIGAATAAQGALADTAIQPGDNANLLGSSGATALQFLKGDGVGGTSWATPANFTDSVPGYAPASGGGTTNFLRADGNWAAPAGGGGGWQDGTTITDWGDSEQTLGTLPTTPTSTVVDLDNGHLITVTIQADHLFNFTSGQNHAQTSWDMIIDTNAHTPTFQFDGVAVELPEVYDISANARYWFTFRKATTGVFVSERQIAQE